MYNWGEPERAPHRSVVGATVVGSSHSRKFVTNMVTSQPKCCVAELWRAMWKAQMREKRGSEGEESAID